MTKSMKTIAIISAIVIAAAIAVFAVCCFLYPDPYEDVIEGSFNVNEQWYQDYINSEKSNVEYYVKYCKGAENLKEYLGPVNSASEAKKMAEKEWFKLYGVWTTIKERPYKASYDSENEVWFVRGTLPDGMVGGMASILIRREDGKVLALWHGC